MLKIDGSLGEGGGQILRTSLALSMCTGKHFQMVNVRAKRPKPGLLRQHLTAVHSAQAICGAEVEGAEISSKAITFTPGNIKSGDYHFAIGTAGSATLVLQTVLPALLCASGPSVLHLEGGTHNPWAPPFHFLQKAFLPVLHRMGVSFTAELKQWGFYPAGGGNVLIRVTPPSGGLKRLDLIERGKLVRAEVLAAVSQIAWDIANDETQLITRSARFPIDMARAETVTSPGPGNVAMLHMEFENGVGFFTGFGQMGVSRKKVAHLVCVAANNLFKTGAAIDEHLADQLLLPFALSGGGSFTTTEPTPHTLTNMDIIRKFIPVKFESVQVEKGLWKIAVLTSPEPNGG